MFDVHYYFTPKFADSLNSRWSDVPVQVTGGNFHPVPGAYVLPQNEGAYYVTSDVSTNTL